MPMATILARQPPRVTIPETQARHTETVMGILSAMTIQQEIILAIQTLHIVMPMVITSVLPQPQATTWAIRQPPTETAMAIPLEHQQHRPTSLVRKAHSNAVTQVTRLSGRGRDVGAVSLGFPRP